MPFNAKYFQQAVSVFVNKSSTTGLTRYNSWDVCYHYFKKLHSMLSISDKKSLTDDEKVDASKELFIYLASWGMYRGSSFLLQFDVSALSNVIDVILSSEFDDLWTLDSFLSIDNKELANKCVSLVEGINNALVEKKKLFEKENDPLVRKREKDPSTSCSKTSTSCSKTLISKIILGTIGCLPAFDTYVCAGLGSGFATEGLFFDKKEHINKNAAKRIEKIYNLAYNNKKTLDGINKETKSDGPYPYMKLLDMYYFVAGNEMGLLSCINKWKQSRNSYVPDKDELKDIKKYLFRNKTPGSIKDLVAFADVDKDHPSGQDISSFLGSTEEAYEN